MRSVSGYSAIKSDRILKMVNLAMAHLTMFWQFIKTINNESNTDVRI